MNQQQQMCAEGCSLKAGQDNELTSNHFTLYRGSARQLVTLTLMKYALPPHSLSLPQARSVVTLP
jgi:hypothetical protein